MQTPVELGSRLELMVDDRLIDRLIGEVALCAHTPTPREIVFPNETDPVIHEDGQGLRAGHGYMTVFQDEGRYRMYHGVGRGHRTDHAKRWVYYAESDDGRRWREPSLGLVEYEGSTDNCIVWSPDLAPFKDGNPACPADQRYKAITMARGESNPADEGGLFAAASADGLSWRLHHEDPIITEGAFDSQNLAFWNSVRGEYRAYWRDLFPGPGGRRYRGIKTATSPDFLEWSVPQWLEYRGCPAEQLYTNQVIPYYRAPHLFVGFPTRYVERSWGAAVAALPEPERRKSIIERTEAERIGTALTDTLFMSSRDGVRFDLRGEAFIRPGLRPIDNWVYGDNYTNWGLVETASDIDGAPNELSFYVTEGSRRDHYSKQYRRYTMRIDGFSSVRASRWGGELLTRPLTFTGRQLVLNCSTSAAGSIAVEIEDANGVPVPGFTAAECVEIIGDDLDRVVRWESGTDLSALATQPIRLHIRMIDADLFAMQFR